MISRNRAIQEALEDKLTRVHRCRLAQESAQLDPQEERALAEEGMGRDFAAWPEY